MFVCSFKDLLIQSRCIRIEYFFQTVIMSIQRKMQLTLDYYCAWILVSTPVTNKNCHNDPVYF